MLWSRGDSVRACLQTGRVVDAVGIHRRADRQARAGRTRVAPRCPGPGCSTPGTVAAARRRDIAKTNACPRRRQAVHPLGQDRHSQSDRSLRAARFSRSDRGRVHRSDRRQAAIRTRRAVDRRRVGAHVYAEPHAVVRKPMGCRCRHRRPARQDSSISLRYFPIVRNTVCGGMCWPRDSSFRSPTSTASITFRSLRPSRSPGCRWWRCSEPTPRFAWLVATPPFRFRGLRSKERSRRSSPRATTPTMSCSTLSSSRGNPVS